VSKGEETRERIVDLAFRLATRDGLGGLSLGKLAGELGVSKSGLFAHFGSKAELELEILKTAQARFIDAVLKSSFQAPRGLPRLRTLFQNWLAWISDPGRPGGCLFLAAAIEFDDDDDGPLRDYVVSMQRAMLATVGKTVALAVSEGHLDESLDCEQFAFEMLGIANAYHLAKRLLRDPRAEARALTAFESRVELARKTRPIS
jgi:AcrR family transcriptional regulator